MQLLMAKKHAHGQEVTKYLALKWTSCFVFTCLYSCEKALHVIMLNLHIWTSIVLWCSSFGSHTCEVWQFFLQPRLLESCPQFCLFENVWSFWCSWDKKKKKSKQKVFQSKVSNEHQKLKCICNCTCRWCNNNEIKHQLSVLKESTL